MKLETIKSIAFAIATILSFLILLKFEVSSLLYIPIMLAIYGVMSLSIKLIRSAH